MFVHTTSPHLVSSMWIALGREPPTFYLADRLRTGCISSFSQNGLLSVRCFSYKSCQYPLPPGRNPVPSVGWHHSRKERDRRGTEHLLVRLPAIHNLIKRNFPTSGNVTCPVQLPRTDPEVASSVLLDRIGWERFFLLSSAWWKLFVEYRCQNAAVERVFSLEYRQQLSDTLPLANLSSPFWTCCHRRSHVLVELTKVKDIKAIQWFKERETSPKWT